MSVVVVRIVRIVRIVMEVVMARRGLGCTAYKDRKQGGKWSAGR